MLLTRRSALLAAGASLTAGCTSWPSVFQAPGRYATRPPLPFAVQEIYPALHMDRIHVGGGLLGQAGRVTSVSDLHVAYDPLTGETEVLPALPMPLHHPQLVSRGRLYVLGGFTTKSGAVNWIMQAKTHVYNDETWYIAPDAPAPHAESVAVAIDERIHIAGGRTPKESANLAYADHVDTNHHLVLDTSTHTWSKAAPALTKRNSAAGSMIGGLWHVVGGRHVTDGPTDAHEVYDPKEDKWRKAAPMPTDSGAGGNAAAVVRGKLYVFGGEYFHDGGKVHAEAWSYDPATDAWTSETPMPTPRHGLGAVAVGDSIFLIGGAKKPSGSETSDIVESFTPGGL